MPQLEPFRGILYNPKKVDISKVVAPPYDVILPDDQDELYRQSEYNIVRLILGKEEQGDSGRDNKYKRAAQFFNTWLSKNILIQDEDSAIYLYSQEYTHRNKKRTNWGLIARMKIEDPKQGKVLPHENTFAKPKQDRLNLIREVVANLSPIFTLFEDTGGAVNRLLKSVFKTRPLSCIKKDGVRHKFWKITERPVIKKIQVLMRDKDIFIADGHHRYEVARMYREEMRNKEGRGTWDEGRGTKDEGRGMEKGYEYVMTYLSPMNEDALTVLATHRLIRSKAIDREKLISRLKAYFDIKTLKTDKELFKCMSLAKVGGCVIGIYFKNSPFYLLKLKKGVDVDSAIREDRSQEWKRLDVSILHGILFDNILGLKEKIHNEECIIYTRDTAYAVSEVKKGNSAAAFFLNPTKITQVRDIARIGDRMPHKSTYFYPKLLSGLVINKLV